MQSLLAKKGKESIGPGLLSLFVSLHVLNVFKAVEVLITHLPQRLFAMVYVRRSIIFGDEGQANQRFVGSALVGKPLQMVDDAPVITRCVGLVYYGIHILDVDEEA